MAIPQGGIAGDPPAVLVRFKEIVRVGSITGPYDGLYYWKITKKDDVDLVGEMMWAYLSGEKRRQFATAAIQMQRPVPKAPSHEESRRFESAWAAGLFDGEGTFCTYRDARVRPTWRGVSMSLPQASATGVPEALSRFRAAVGRGTISGPRMVASPWSRLPQYRWQASGRHVVSAAAKVIWPWLGPVKRAEIRAAMEHLDPDVGEWMIDA